MSYNFDLQDWSGDIKELADKIDRPVQSIVSRALCLYVGVIHQLLADSKLRLALIDADGKVVQIVKNLY